MYSSGSVNNSETIKNTSCPTSARPPSPSSVNYSDRMAESRARTANLLRPSPLIPQDALGPSVPRARAIGRQLGDILEDTVYSTGWAKQTESGGRSRPLGRSPVGWFSHNHCPFPFPLSSQGTDAVPPVMATGFEGILPQLQIAVPWKHHDHVRSTHGQSMN